MNPDPSRRVVLPASDGPGCYSLDSSRLTIDRAKITTERFNGNLVVSFELIGSDAGALDRLAQANYQHQVAMVMFGEVLSAPTINATAFHGSDQISGLTEQQASQIASALDPNS
jgi:preprotein translocase subunit SecD